MEGILSRLPRDYQLNLYAKFAELFSRYLELDPKKFKGCLYRVTTKTTISQKSNESVDAYFNRLYKTVKSMDVFIPVENMDIENVWKRHLESYERSMALRNGEAPTRNYSYCESYFRPCPWWSQCHGDINSKCCDKVILNTAESFNRKNNTILDVL